MSKKFVIGASYVGLSLTISVLGFLISVPHAGAQVAGALQTVPAGYALVGIGYGSDDHQCWLYIREGELTSGGIIDRGWKTKRCWNGGGNDTTQAIGTAANHYLTGWTWDGGTSGGTGWQSFNDSAPAGDQACYFQAYRKIDPVTGKLTGPIMGWGSPADGTCNDRNYAGWDLKITTWVSDIPDACNSGGVQNCAPIVNPAVSGDTVRVITDIQFSLAADGDANQPVWSANALYDGIINAQPYSDNLPPVFSTNQSLITGSDGQPLRVTMRNLGKTWTSNNARDAAGTGSGTCQVDTNSDGVLDCPSTTNAIGTSCTIQRSNGSTVYRLEHVVANFFQGATDPAYYDKRTSQTCSIISQQCSNPDPSCQTSYSACTSTSPPGYCSIGGCPDQPTCGGICHGSWTSTGSACYGTWTTGGKGFSKTTTGDPNIYMNGTADFFLDSLIAPATGGNYTESWQMNKTDTGTLFGSQFNKSITVYTPTFVIAPPSATIIAGQSQQFTGYYDPDGPSGPQGQSDVTASASWISSNPAVASFASPGRLNGLSSGSVAITANYSGISANATLNVNSGSIVAALTINGQKSAEINVEDTFVLVWSSTGADAAEMTNQSDSNPPSAPWLVNPNGTSNSLIVPAVWAGHVITYNFTARNIATGRIATSSVTISPLGTIQVNSVNSVTGGPVPSSWSFLYNISDPCQGSISLYCSGTSKTYPNMPQDMYTNNPVANSAGTLLSFGGTSSNLAVVRAGNLFALDFLRNLFARIANAYTVLPSQTQTLGLGNGLGAIVFTINWDPIAGISASPTSLNLTDTGPPGTVSVSNTGAAGSVLNWAYSVSYGAGYSGWLNIIPLSGSITQPYSPTNPSTPVSISYKGAGTLPRGINTSAVVSFNGTSPTSPRKMVAVGSSQFVTINISTAIQPLTITPDPVVPSPTVNTPYQFTAQGGIGAPYTCSISGPQPVSCAISEEGVPFRITFPYAGDYTMMVTDASGRSDSVNFNVTVPNASCSLTADPKFIIPPATTTLTWQCRNVSMGSCTLTPPGVSVPCVGTTSLCSGSYVVAPVASTSYVLYCGGVFGGSETRMPLPIDVREKKVIEY